ncbi:hypothetical protein AK812_SmicGene11023 [Symbiodinium microadriaticum]|uniref:Uncharacterized protein n=1 Tax=Symbiodinium microadriaticum TaxID=2951 RepID=A0A1Q9EE87_SYMMI|nr:hypothetical protein AK812_SmicGene11023 [Symbiodinium microadriaticum]
MLCRMTSLSWWTSLFLCLAAPKGCHLAFDERTGETGHSFLARCALAARSAAEAVGTGRELPLGVPELRGCLDTSSQLQDEALREERCSLCPEGCVLVLLLEALAFPAQHLNVRHCSLSLMFYFRASMYFKEFEPHWTLDLRDNLAPLVNVRRGQCASARERELQGRSLPQRQPSAVQTSRRGHGSLLREEQAAVLIAATPAMLKKYQPFINLWRCYALRHGHAFLLETDEGEAPAPNWLRWYAARRYLPLYAAILLVDPDQIIMAPCWDLSIIELAGTWPERDASRPLPDVGLRDFGRPQTLNNGVVLLRNSVRGNFFLELLLEKALWFQTIERDQGPFDETILEVLGMEAQMRHGATYDSECSQYLFPNHQGNHEVSLYALCWWRVSEELAGPFGDRNSSIIRFVDPRLTDINHVVGARGLSDPALLYHFAGRSKDWEAMLETFGLDAARTRACQEVFSYVDNRSSLEDCVPGGGKVIMDYAYGGGPLLLSEVAQHLDQTFCSRDKCHMGIISAGGASSLPPVMSSKLNNEKQAGIAKDEVTVYFFDDHTGNAAEMAEFGFNGREIACEPRDQMIGDGIVGLCGALLPDTRGVHF